MSVPKRHQDVFCQEGVNPTPVGDFTTGRYFTTGVGHFTTGGHFTAVGEIFTAVEGYFCVMTMYGLNMHPLWQNTCAKCTKTAEELLAKFKKCTLNVQWEEPPPRPPPLGRMQSKYDIKGFSAPMH